MNINPKTNIRYGVIAGSKVSDLMETIFELGIDEDYELWRNSKLAEIKFLLCGDRNVQDDVDALAAFIKENTNESDPFAEAASILVDQDDEKASDEDAEAVFNRLNLGDKYQNDEPMRTYTDSDGNVFQMTYLGGAPLIWCIQTDNIVFCNSLCSPCVPNAGDLNSGLVKANGDAHREGFQCYGIPKRWLAKNAKNR